jgi:hypothetical protein
MELIIVCIVYRKDSAAKEKTTVRPVKNNYESHESHTFSVTLSLGPNSERDSILPCAVNPVLKPYRGRIQRKTRCIVP